MLLESTLYLSKPNLSTTVITRVRDCPDNPRKRSRSETAGDLANLHRAGCST